MASLRQQLESRAEAAQKQHSALQEQYEGSVQASRQLWDQHGALQKDRDRCWEALQAARAELADARADRDSLTGALQQAKVSVFAKPLISQNVTPKPCLSTILRQSEKPGQGGLRDAGSWAAAVREQRQSHGGHLWAAVCTHSRVCKQRQAQEPQVG